MSDLTPFVVKISYSAKRKRTVSARLEGDVLLVTAPSNINKDRLEKIVEKLKGRINSRRQKARLKKDRPLEEITQKINRKYFENRLNVRSIEYSHHQKKRYGSCDHVTGTIRISSRIKDVPGWVRDYVIVHEMAHLIEPNHGKDFYDLVARYELAERARGYLMGMTGPGFYVDT